MSEADIRNEIEAALKRSASGFLKTVGVWAPKEESAQYNRRMQPPIFSYEFVKEKLRENYTIKTVDLTSGRISGDVDVLLIIAPQKMGDKERFAVDQYLMRGGALIVAGGNYALERGGFGSGLSLRKIDDGLKELLGFYGVDVKEELVLDTQNEPFPIPVTRNLGGIQVQEIRQVDYPYFVDVRKDGMDPKSPVVSGLSAVTMHWTSPLEIDQEKNKHRKVTILLKSSPESWVMSTTDIQPDFQHFPETGFSIEGDRGSRVLAVSLSGPFESYFKDKRSPLFEEEEKKNGAGDKKETKETDPIVRTITSSPDSSRLVVIGSAEFLNDTMINISRTLGQDRFLSGLDFLENLIDWSVEDEDLLAIRSRGSHARILRPMTRARQTFWEATNYVIVIVSLLLIAVFSVWSRRREQPMVLVKPDHDVPRVTGDKV
jgi:ABC-2 type transport system permease protein